jgi:hypothetical protein
MRDKFLNKDNTVLPKAKFLSGVERCLKQLNLYVLDMELEFDGDINEIDKDCSPKKQKILKDFGVIDILVDTIYYPFQNGFYSLADLNQSMTITKMFGLVYTTIRRGIAEYRPNELYASQWLSLMMDHAMKTRVHNDIQAGKTLTELIDNNSKILESRISKDMIHRYIEFVRTWEKDAKYIMIIRAMCICDNAPVVHNQNMLSETILKNAEVRNDLLVQVVEKNSETYVWIPDERNWIRISDLNRVKSLKFDSNSGLCSRLPSAHELYENEEAKKRQKFLEYFTSITLLMSDLCFERNYIAIEILKDLFPLGICLNILMNDSNSFDIRRAFCLFTMNLWFDAMPFSYITIPNNIKIWRN